MIICVLTGLLTPLGDTPYTYLYKTMQGNTTQNINEHFFRAFVCPKVHKRSPKFLPPGFLGFKRSNGVGDFYRW